MNGNHISGSAAWFAKADCGITVLAREPHRFAVGSPVQMDWYSGQPKLSYDPVNGRYKGVDWKSR